MVAKMVQAKCVVVGVEPNLLWGGGGVGKVVGKAVQGGGVCVVGWGKGVGVWAAVCVWGCVWCGMCACVVKQLCVGRGHGEGGKGGAKVKGDMSFPSPSKNNNKRP